MKIFYIIGVIEIIITYFTYMKMGYMYNGLLIEFITPNIIFICIIKLIIVFIIYIFNNYTKILEYKKTYILLKIYIIIILYSIIKNIMEMI